MDNYETFNYVLVTLVQKVTDIERKAIITPEFKDITYNDMHVIEAIGLETESPNNMSTIAKRLRVTTGTLTISMNSLVRKGYVERTRSNKDRRVVYITLTEKGRAAYAHHAEFHKELTTALTEGISPEDAAALKKPLDNLISFFENYDQKLSK